MWFLVFQTNLTSSISFTISKAIWCWHTSRNMQLAVLEIIWSYPILANFLLTFARSTNSAKSRRCWIRSATWLPNAASSWTSWMNWWNPDLSRCLVTPRITVMDGQYCHLVNCSQLAQVSAYTKVNRQVVASHFCAFQTWCNVWTKEQWPQSYIFPSSTMPHWKKKGLSPLLAIF